MSAMLSPDAKEEGSHGRIKAVIDFIGWSGTPEQEQAILRLIIPLTFLAYLLLNNTESSIEQTSFTVGVAFITTFLAFATVLFVSTLIWNKPSNTIRLIGILGDIGALSLGLGITGETGAPWYGVYLWVTLGNGFRYGESYLYLSTAISIIGFGCVALFTEYWGSHSAMAIGLELTLLVIPAYSSILIRRLNEARQHADAASRAKSDFLSCMSHEIRTPLNGILGMTDLLRLRPLSPGDKECVETIHTSGHALARQINEILDLSKIEAGRMTLEEIDFDLYVLVNTTLRIFQTQAQGKGLTLRVIIDPSTPFLLFGDPHKIRQIITNLVGNALKFTSRGSIALHVSIKSNLENKALLRFEIIDTGTGIPEDRLQNIFDPFTQASDSVTRNYGGTGLGTTISKNLVEIMGGAIGVESTLDVGTTFWFEIPLVISKKQADTSVDNWAIRCRVVYLTPSIDESDPITKKLDEWGVQYEAFTSIERAHSILTSSSNLDALIVKDMPTSKQLTNILNCKDTDYPATPYIIVISSEQHIYDMPERQQSLFLIKTPLENNLLLNALHACYARHGAENDIIHFARKQVNEQHIKRQLNVLVGDDNSTNRIVMQRMLEKLGHRYTIVNGGEAALMALENDQFDAAIIDKNMPDMGGIEVYQAYYLAHGGNATVVFAILTADATAESKASCNLAGINHFLTKPLSLDRLADTLEDMCGTGEDALNSTEPHQAPKQSDSNSEEFFNETEFTKLNELSAGDSNFINEVIGNFINDTNKNIRGLESAVARSDWLEFRDFAHALKGSSLYLGFARLAQMSRDAQDISQEDFLNDGISRVVAIRKAADAAFILLNSKLTDNSQSKVAS